MTFAASPIPRPAGPPASAAPLRDYLAGVHNGVDPGYVVVPRSLAESMPLLWQQQLVHLLAELQHAYGHLPWPIYRVVPSRTELLVDLDEEQLAEVGCLVEIDSDGELRYRDRQGRIIEHPERHQVLVSCLDPIPRARTSQTQAQPQPRARQPQARQPQSRQAESQSRQPQPQSRQPQSQQTPAQATPPPKPKQHRPAPIWPTE